MYLLCSAVQAHKLNLLIKSFILINANENAMHIDICYHVTHSNPNSLETTTGLPGSKCKVNFSNFFFFLTIGKLRQRED